MTERRIVGNLIKPRPIPPFTAATTSSARWIDGTAAGSTTDLGYGWYSITGVGNMAYSITEEGLTIAATTATGRGRVMTAPFETTTTKQNINNYGIPVKANTSYTFSYKAKGTNILASSTRAGVILFTTGGATVATPAPSYIPKGDSDWTDYSVTFTTGATVAYAVIYPGVFTAGNIMSATFKDFKLDTTTPTTRTTATSRTTATNRVAVRDMGTALRFDGVDDYVASNTPLPIEQGLPHTVSMWFKLNTNTTDQRLFNNYVTSAKQFTFGLRGSNNLIEGAFYNGASYSGGTKTSIKIERNTKYHLVWLYDGSTSLIFINGILRNGGISNLGGALGSAGWTIGQRNDRVNASVVNGIIDEPRIWNRALTPTEIQNLYLHNIVPQDGLVAEYLFDEASGTTALDTSGNGNNGTITGATYTTDVPLKPRV